MSTLVTYEIDHISVLRDSTIRKYVFTYFVNLKEKDQIKKYINSKKRDDYIGNQYYSHFGLLKIRVGWGRTTNN